jgi:Flp pilus assembly pilin Flp
MKSLMIRFWQDDRGAFLNTAELIFLATLLAIGIIPGATALRDAIVTEFADMAAAVNAHHLGRGNGVSNGNGNGLGNGANGNQNAMSPIDGPDGGQILTAASLLN